MICRNQPKIISPPTVPTFSKPPTSLNLVPSSLSCAPTILQYFQTAAIIAPRVSSLTPMISQSGARTLKRSGEWFRWIVIRQRTFWSPRRRHSKPSSGAAGGGFACHWLSAKVGCSNVLRQCCHLDTSVVRGCRSRSRGYSQTSRTSSSTCQGVRCHSVGKMSVRRSHGYGLTDIQ
jgi:hypothetical protein